MSLSLEQIADEALRLSPPARAELAERLIASLDLEPDENQRPWIEEAVRRCEEVRSGTVSPIPGEEVMGEMRRLSGQ